MSSFSSMGHELGMKDRQRQTDEDEKGEGRVATTKKKKESKAHLPEGMMGLLVVCEPDETF